MASIETQAAQERLPALGRPQPSGGEGRSLLDWIRVLRDGLPALVLLTLLGLGVGVLVTALQPTEYRSEATLVAGSSRGFLEPEWADGLAPVASTVTRLASSAAVLEGAGREYIASAPDATTRQRRRDEVSQDWLEEHLTARQVADSGIVELAGVASTQRDARDLSRAGARSLEEQIQRGPGSNVPVEPGGGGSREARGIVVRDFQSTDKGQVSPTPVRNLLLGGNVGLLLGIVAGLAMGATRRRLRRPDEMAAELGIPVLASVRAGKRSAAAFRRGLSAARARLQRFSTADRGTVFLLTGTATPERTAQLGEGLARAFSASSRTVLVDADLSGRFASESLELDDLPGLGELLNGQGSRQTLFRPEHVLVTTNGTEDGSEISVLPAGQAPSDPAAALSGAALARSLESLRLQYDFVLVIGPSLDRPEEVIPLASAVDWSVLITPQGERARTFDRAHALALTDALAGRVAGALIVDRR